MTYRFRSRRCFCHFQRLFFQFLVLYLQLIELLFYFLIIERNKFLLVFLEGSENIELNEFCEGLKGGFGLNGLLLSLLFLGAFETLFVGSLVFTAGAEMVLTGLLNLAD